MDLDGGKVTASRTLLTPSKETRQVLALGDEPLFGPLKARGEGETRSMTIDADTVRLLRRHRTHQDQIVLKNGSHC